LRIAPPPLPSITGTNARALVDGDLAAVSTLVGAMVLARATAGTGLSDEILDVAAA
jgi:hypothetical protein